MTSVVTVVEMSLDDITPAEYNPRADLKPGDQRYDQIKYSIGKFGLVDPLVWNARTQRLVGGHQRLKVLRDLGHDIASVSVVDLDEIEERKLNVSLNRVQGEWDLPALQDMLAGRVSEDQQFLRMLDLQVPQLQHQIEAQREDALVGWLDDPTALPAVSVGAPEIKTEHPDRLQAETYFQIQFVFTSEQRDDVYAAINHCKDNYGLDQSGEALAIICRAYMERHQ